METFKLKSVDGKGLLVHIVGDVEHIEGPAPVLMLNWNACLIFYINHTHTIYVMIIKRSNVIGHSLATRSCGGDIQSSVPEFWKQFDVKVYLYLNVTVYLYLYVKVYL